MGKRYYSPMSYYINQVLASHQLTGNTSWTENVRKLMSDGRRLVRQNMVVERSAQ